MESLTPNTLTPAQVQVVAALVQGATVTDAAKSAGVHRTNIYNWLENQLEFQTAVEDARAEYAATLGDELQVLSRDALATLRSLLDDPGTPRTLRFRVAMAILQRPQSPEHDWNLPEPASGLQEIHPRDDSEAVSEVSNVSNVSNVSEQSNMSELENPSKVSNSVEPGLAPRKTPRNQPCPCGSGRKYKKCCYLNEPASQFLTAA